MGNIAAINEITHPEVKHARIRLNDGWDIIRVTYTDDGFIQIFSSFGHYGYHWTAMGEGVTLQQFFGDREEGNNHYLANKLWDHRNSTEYFDLDEAIKDVKEYLQDEGQCCNCPDKETMKEIEEAIDYNISGMGDSHDLFISNWMSTPLLNEWIPEIYFHSFGMRTKGRYKALLNDIIPTIQKYFRGELKDHEQHP